MENICINTPESIGAIVGGVVLVASTISNFIPAPDKIGNPVAKLISRVVHFVAVDIVTAKK